MYSWIVSGYHIKKEEEEEEKECAVSFGWRVPGGRVDVKDAGQWVWESQRRIVSNDECATVRFSLRIILAASALELLSASASAFCFGFGCSRRPLAVYVGELCNQSVPRQQRRASRENASQASQSFIQGSSGTNFR